LILSKQKNGVCRIDLQKGGFRRFRPFCICRTLLERDGNDDVPMHAKKRAQAEDVDYVDVTDFFVRFTVVDPRERVKKQSKPIGDPLCHSKNDGYP